MTLFDSYQDPYSITEVLSDVDIMSPRAPCSNAAEIRQANLKRDQRVDEESAQSFPASDPPSWVQGISA